MGEFGRGRKIAIAGAMMAGCILLGGCQRSEDESANAAGRTAINVQTASTRNAFERGRYLVTIMDCAGCHNTGAMSPNPQAGYLEGGTVGFEMPGMGVFWPPNLTPHPDAGLGTWSEAQIVAALRTGVRPDGRQLAPIMPWPSYAKLTDQDARAIAAYLKSLPPSDHKVPTPAQPGSAAAPYLTVKTPSGTG